MSAGSVPLSTDAESDSTDVDEEQSENEDYACTATRDVTRVLRDAKSANSMGKICEKHLVVALSVGFWVAVFGIPIFELKLNYWIFGQRSLIAAALNATHVGNFTDRSEHFTLSCSEKDILQMRNIAEEGEYPDLVRWNGTMSAWDSTSNSYDIWCGLVPRAYADYWPNAAQFIVFTVFKNTGTTISFAWQGILGTVLATWNMHLMTSIFPEGAKGHLCVNATDADAYVVFAKSSKGGWTKKVTHSLDLATWEFEHADSHGGLQARAIYLPGGALDMTHSWFASSEIQKEAKAHLTAMWQEDCEPGTIVYNDPNYAAYGELACMFNVFFVVFLFLFAKAERNTVMFALSWHTVWMMNFMNPDLGVTRAYQDRGWLDWTFTEYFVVEATSLVGALVAIVATLVPCARLQNLHHLYDDAIAVNLAIVTIWSDAVEYLAGNERSAMRLQIETQIDALQGTASEVRENIDGAWWESLGFGRSGRKRRLLKHFVINAVDIKDWLCVVKTCVLNESFEGMPCGKEEDGVAGCDQHKHFWETMRPAAEDLARATSQLTWVLLETFEDGDMSAAEIKRIERQHARVKESQRALMRSFLRAAPPISEDLSEEQTFIFALACWSRKSSDFAEHAVELARGGELNEKSLGVVCRMFYSLQALFDPQELLKHQHLKYAFRNWLSICTCFVLGYYAEGSIFTRYNYVMSMTLTLLFVSEGSHIIEYEKCAHRLLGVFLGRSLPIIIIACVNTAPCEMNHLGFMLQFLAVWCYVTLWCFLYYNSDKWSYVSCLIGGFGIYGLMVPRCSEAVGASHESLFASKYRELGNVTVAIFIQAAMHSVLSRRSARLLLSKRLQQFGEALLGGVRALFEADVAGIQAATREASARLAMARTLAPECDPKKKLFRGRQAALQMDLCSSILNYSELALGELCMLDIAAADWVPNRALLESGDEGGSDDEASSGILEMLCGCGSMALTKEHLLPSVSVMAHVVPSMVGAAEKSAWQEELRKPKDVKADLLLEAVGHLLYKELSQRVSARHLQTREEYLTNDVRVRLAIAAWSLQNLAIHVGKIEELCMKEAMLRA